MFQDYDPFGDTAAQPVASQTPAAQRDPLEGYNPFEKDATPAVAAPADVTPAVLTTAPLEQPPSYAASTAQQVDKEHYLQQQRELDQKARELEARERELRAKDEQLREQQRQQQQATSTGGKNWPPLPSWIPIRPCFHQDIEMDIPTGFQHLVKQMYYIWMAHTVLLLLNFIGGLAFLSIGAVLTTLLGIIYLISVPCAYVCWFRPVYKAFKSDSSLNFMLFFFIFGFQTLIHILFAIGYSTYGFCGFFTGITYLTSPTDKNIALGIICVTIGALVGILAALDVFMLIRIHRLYRGNEAVSMAKARSEGITGLMRNKDVRDTVVNVGAQAATAAATGN